jgi:hypothetical protein
LAGDESVSGQAAKITESSKKMEVEHHSLPEVWGLIGVALGFLMTTAADFMRRRAERKEKARDLRIKRGEELLQKLEELYQWSEQARRIAFTGDIYVPIQVPVFRFAAIVEIFYPQLSQRAKDLDSQVTTYRNVLIDIAANKTQGKPMTEPLMARLAKNAEELPVAIGHAIADTRDAVRAQLEK